MKNHILALVKESIEVKQKAVEEHVSTIEEISKILIQTFQQNHRVFFCGNGGSAADSQHFAAELVGRFQKERRALPAIALTTDTSILTSLSNDYHYDIVFSRQLEALGSQGDVLVGISTSGMSLNIIKAFEVAKKLKIKTIALTGRDGGAMAKMADISIIVPSNVTARIQEVHLTFFHIICQMIDGAF